MKDILLDIPQTSHSAEGFAVYVPKAQLVPRADPDWAEQAVARTLQECAISMQQNPRITLQCVSMLPCCASV